MRYGNALLVLCMLTAMPFVSCEKDEEAEKVSLPGGGGGTGGGGGGGGGGCGSGLTNTAAGPVSPGAIDINSEFIWSANGSGTDYVLYDSTCWFQAVLATTGGIAQSASFGLGGMPDQTTVTFSDFTFAGTDATQAELDAFFAPGSKSFAGGGAATGLFINMVTDIMAGATAVYTSSVCTQPASSYFTITDSEPYDDGSGMPGVKVRAVWKCSIWNNAYDEIACNDGVFVGYFSGDAQ